MALNQNIRNLIQAVADNQIDKAKTYINILIQNETAESNKIFCNQIKEKLKKSSSKLLELPANMNGLLTIEDTTLFNKKRFFLSDREKNIVEKIISIKKATEKLSDIEIKYLNSILLYGESGVGKTTFGRYIANELNLPFVYVNFSQCINSHLGETGKNLNKIFNFVKNSPCIFMLDEIDAIASLRGRDNDVGEATRIVIALMQALDMLENDVIIIAATNRINIIDNAIKRRFNIKHEIELLHDDEIYNFALQFINSLNIDYNISDLELWSKKVSRKQSEIINDIIQRFIVSICNNKNIDFN